MDTMSEQKALEHIWGARMDAIKWRDNIDEVLTYAKLTEDQRHKLTRAANLLEQAYSVLNATA